MNSKLFHTTIIATNLLCNLLPEIAGAEELSQKSCWFYHHVETGNQLNLCLNKEQAELRINYPNHGHPKSTSCLSTGSARWKSDHEKAVIERWSGPCKNNRVTGPTRLDCMLMADKKLDCIDHMGNKIKFEHVGTGT